MHRPARGGSTVRDPLDPDHSDFAGLEACEYRFRASLWPAVPELDAFLARLRRAGGHHGRDGRRVLDAVRSRLTYREKGHDGADPGAAKHEVGPRGLPGLRPPVPGSLPRARPAGRYVSGYVSEAGELGDPRLVSGLGRAARLGGYGPDSRQLADETFVKIADRPRLLRRPAQPWGLEGSWRGEDRRRRQGRADFRVLIDWTNYSTQQPWSSTSSGPVRARILALDS